MNILQKFSLLLDFAEKQNYSDVHINSSYAPIVRNNSGDIISVSMLTGTDGEEVALNKIQLEDSEEILKHVLGVEGFEKFLMNGEIDGSFKHSETARYRINAYKDTNGYSLAMRAIAQEIPTLESLGLGEQVKTLCRKSKGLVLVTGPTGSGKSTNLAAMIDYINTNLKKHIITVEDPIEFVFQNKSSLINQREVGTHTGGFASAIKGSLREDPDVIMIGEMRDPETIKAAITLAETGHLVFSTLHTNDTVQSVDRIIDVFPSGQQDQIRMQLAMSLAGIIAQRLVPKLDADARVPAREILLNNDAVRNLIISGKTHQLYSVIEIGQRQGMILMDSYLIALYKKGLISREILEGYVRDKENVEILQ